MNEKRFDGKGEIYSKYRPSYPIELIDYLYITVGMEHGDIIADIGSGTGILTKLLLEKGSRLYAVEPNEDMRAVAERELCRFENYIPVAGAAEGTGLFEQSVDFIIAAQAFHWFDQKHFTKECRRILKPGGKIVLVWNYGDVESGIVSENDAINRMYCPEYKGSSGGANSVIGNGFSDFFIGDYSTKVFENAARLDEDHFVGRNLSSSYAPRKGEENYEAYVKTLRELFGKYCDGSYVEYPYLTHCYVGNV